MKSRTFIHLFFLLLILVITAIAYLAIYRAALIRGYEPSAAYAIRNLVLLGVLFIIPLIITRISRFAGDWTIYTTAILLFALGSVVQYRLASDPEFTKNITARREAKELKVEALQLRYIKENYSVEKKQFAGMPAVPPAPANLDEEKHRLSTYSTWSAISDTDTWKTFISIFACAAVFFIFKRDSVLNWIQRNGFLVAFMTLFPLIAAVLLAYAIGAIKNGKVTGGLTPWELSKIPFLLGFSAILGVLYQNLARTYWGFPRAQDTIPVIFMMGLPFVPFLLLQDFGQMMVFLGVYIVVFLLAVRKFPQRLVFVGSVVLVATLLIVASLPKSIQEKVPALASIAKPVRDRMPNRIQQRFYLWFDLFNPPSPDTKFWQCDLVDYYTDNYRDTLANTEDNDLANFYPDNTEADSTKAISNDKSCNAEKVAEKYQITLPTAQEIPDVVKQLNAVDKELGELNKKIKEKTATDADKKQQKDDSERHRDLRTKLWLFAKEDMMAMYEISTHHSPPAKEGESPILHPEEIKDRPDDRTELQQTEESDESEESKATPQELKKEQQKLVEAKNAIIQATDKVRKINEDAWFNDDALQATLASFGLSSGGVTGRGLGLGYVEMIPEAETDYVYAALGEELGVVGGLLIFIALIIFVNAGIRAALDARDMFSKLCAAGLTAFIGFQALVNIGGITRALPMTGITLPFVSHGGFSLLTSFAMLGMLLAISHRNGVDARTANVAQKK